MRAVLSEPGQLCPPIWSCTSRGLPCPMLPPGRWALTPPFHPYRRCQPLEDVPKVFLRAITGLLRRRYILCGAVRDACRRRVLTRPAAHVPWRYQARCPSPCQALTAAGQFSACADSVSGLSSRPCRLRGSDQRSSGSPASAYYTARLGRV